MTTLGNGRIVAPDGVLDPGWVRLDGDRIAEVGAGAVAAVDIDLAGRTLVPGFVDIHVHGGGGGSYTSADPASIRTAAEFHRSHGTTTTIASLVSDRREALEQQVAALATAHAEGLVAGIHLEGPWLSPAKRGAHNPDVLRSPDPAEVDRLLELGDSAIRMVTLAPELPGGLAAVRRFVEAGVVAAVGHTSATYAEAGAAVEAGASVATHLYNAMPSLHHREPGPVAALLEDSRVTVELVADGLHVHPAMLGLALRAAGPERVALVTDAMDAAGMPEGDYDLAGLAVRVESGAVRLIDGGSLAGSTLTMDAALRLVVRELGVSLEEASAMASAAPARVLGLTDVGAIRSGLRADLVVLSDDLDVVDVLVAGQPLPR